MQAILGLGGLFAKGASTVASWASSGSGLAAAKFGTTALSSIAGFGMANGQAGQADTAAEMQTLAGNQTMIQASQTQNDILRQYNRTVGAQLSTAAAEGVDVASGSVKAAGDYAQSEADRQLSIVRSGAVMNAQLRYAQAAALKQVAGADRLSGVLGLAAGLGKGALQLFSTGGPAKPAGSGG